MTANWAGPLFYPPVGKIAVTASGCRIEVWDDESESADCFTGLLLTDARNAGRAAVFDLSVCWGREFIDHIEEPTPEDVSRSFWPGRRAA